MEITLPIMRNVKRKDFLLINEFEIENLKPIREVLKEVDIHLIFRECPRPGSQVGSEWKVEEGSELEDGDGWVMELSCEFRANPEVLIAWSTT